MPYVRRTWQNAPSSATPLNAAALNNIEDGVEEALAKPGATDAAVEAIIADTGSDTYATLNSTIGAVVDDAVTPVAESLEGDPRFVTAKAVANRRDASLTYAPVAARPMWPNNLQSGTTNNTCNARIRHVISAATRSLRLVYVNAYGNEASTPPNSIIVSAGIELTGGTVLPVLFSGNATITIAPNGYAISDPVSVDLLGADVIRSRTHVKVTAGQKFPVGFNGVGSGLDEGGEQGVDLTDKSLSGSIPTSGGAFLYGPSAILGAGGDTLTRASVALVGDSILFGQGEELAGATFGGRFGFGQRALNDEFQYVQTAQSGDTISSWLSNSANRLRLIDGCTHALVEYATNDLTGGNSAATIAAWLITGWKRLAARGMRVIQTTLTPQATSTDGYMTAAAQTAFANEAARVGLNDWIRDGAPIVAGAYVAAGSTNPAAIRAGAAGHPLSGYFEIADSVETARNSGKWRTDNTRTIADGAITSGANQLDSATANFTSADLDKYVRVAGAGAAGAQLVARITAITNATRVVLSSNAGTTVSGASCIIGNRTTADGIHPLSYGHALMAAAVVVAEFRRV